MKIFLILLAVGLSGCSPKPETTSQERIAQEIKACEDAGRFVTRYYRASDGVLVKVECR